MGTGQGGAKVVDINKSTEIPANHDKKKNKNDFYRFLLTQNNSINVQETKINNDILIPRSILKKGERSRALRKSTFPITDDDPAYPNNTDGYD